MSVSSCSTEQFAHGAPKGVTKQEFPPTPPGLPGGDCHFSEAPGQQRTATNPSSAASRAAGMRGVSGMRGWGKNHRPRHVGYLPQSSPLIEIVPTAANSPCTVSYYQSPPETCFRASPREPPHATVTREAAVAGHAAFPTRGTGERSSASHRDW